MADEPLERLAEEFPGLLVDDLPWIVADLASDDLASDDATVLPSLPTASAGGEEGTAEAAGVEFSLSVYSGVLDEEIFFTAAVPVCFAEPGGLPDPLVPCRTKK